MTTSQPDLLERARKYLIRYCRTWQPPVIASGRGSTGIKNWDSTSVESKEVDMVKRLCLLLGLSILGLAASPPDKSIWVSPVFKLSGKPALKRLEVPIRATEVPARLGLPQIKEAVMSKGLEALIDASYHVHLDAQHTNAGADGYLFGECHFDGRANRFAMSPQQETLYIVLYAKASPKTYAVDVQVQPQSMPQGYAQFAVTVDDRSITVVVAKETKHLVFLLQSDGAGPHEISLKIVGSGWVDITGVDFSIVH